MKEGRFFFFWLVEALNFQIRVPAFGISLFKVADFCVSLSVFKKKMTEQPFYISHLTTAL